MLDKKLFLILLPILAAVLLGGLLSCSRADNPWDNSSLDVTDPEGTLEVSATVLNVDGASKVAKLYATYQDSKGLYRPDLISIEPLAESENLEGNHKVFMLEVGSYTVSAGNLSIGVEVVRKE